MDAYEDGRLTIWPRTGQEVWFDATGMCERCPVRGTDECKRPEEAKLEFGDPDTCPPYVSSENWLGDTDVDQKLAFLEGAYHMSEDEARTFGVSDGEYADVELCGERRSLFYDVQIRVHKDFRLEMHIDTDDANAAGVGNGFKAKLIKRS